jgi:hypothetical protein
MWRACNFIGEIDPKISYVRENETLSHGIRKNIKV